MNEGEVPPSNSAPLPFVISTGAERSGEICSSVRPQNQSLVPQPLFPLVISTGAYPDFLPHSSRQRPRMRLSVKRDAQPSPISLLSTGNSGERSGEICSSVRPQNQSLLPRPLSPLSSRPERSAVERSAVRFDPKTNLYFRNPSPPLSSLHRAPPDFLCRVVRSVKVVRLSSRRAAYVAVVESCEVGNPGTLRSR